MVKKRNLEERRERFEKYFKQHDQDDTGKLNFDDFKKFLKQYNKKEMRDREYEFLFRGMDIDRNEFVDKEELWKVVEAMHSKDKIYMNKIFFRGVDSDRDRLIDSTDFVTMAEMNNILMTKTQAEEKIKDITDGKEKLNFIQMYKILTDDDIEDDTDPYDNKIPGQINEKNVKEDEEKKKMKTLIKKFDKDSNGKLRFNEFLKFMKEALEFEETKCFVKQMRFLYNGIDINSTNDLDEDEILNCIENFKSQNFKYLTKMFFRGADKDHSRKIVIVDVQDAVDNLGCKPFSKEEFEKKCTQEFGKSKKDLLYWEFYKIFTGEIISKDSTDYDPYDGKIIRSKCCILI